MMRMPWESLRALSRSGWLLRYLLREPCYKRDKVGVKFLVHRCYIHESFHLYLVTINKSQFVGRGMRTKKFFFA